MPRFGDPPADAPPGPASVAGPDATHLAAAVRDGRDRAIELVADLSDAQLIGPLLATVNPMLWEIGHLAWFQEKFVLRQACGDPPLLDYADSIWDSGAVPHDTRWRLTLPSRGETIAFMNEVGNRVAQRVLEPGATDVVRHFARYTVYHYDWHTEALTYTRQTLGYPAPAMSKGPPPAGPAREGDHRGATHVGVDGDVDLAGATMLLGGLRSQPFVYDNEKWAHPVVVAPFAISRGATTQKQFLAFVADGGYQRRALWSTDGWAWRHEVGAAHPRYWRRQDNGEWSRRLFDRWVALEPGRPMIHVNWFEADAWARWAGRRLPTEAEWELAAGGAPGPAGGGRSPFPWGDTEPTPEQANLDWSGRDTVDVGRLAGGDSASGCRQMMGNVWEWTASTFCAYPNFEPDAYRENSEQFFGTRKVLRGGSWATRSRLVRTTLRNYLTPDRCDGFTGFRTCAGTG